MTYITAVSMLSVSAGGLAAFAVVFLCWLMRLDDLREITAERDKWRRLETEAAKYVEVPIIMRTHFSGEPPYVGWEGLGLALNEALDERDALRARVAELEGTYGKLRVAAHSLIQGASIRTAKEGPNATR